MIGALIRAESWTRHLVPAVISFLLLSVQYLPWGGVAGPIVPCFGLMSLFYWSMRQPSLMPGLLALLLGCFGDLMALTPLGSQGLVFLAVSSLAGRGRKRIYAHAFLTLWAIFCLVCIAQQACLWLASAVLSWTIVPVAPLLPQTLSSLILFPVVARLLLLPAERLVMGHAP